MSESDRSHPLWSWGLEVDPGRQLRRLRRIVGRTSAGDELRRAVEGRRILVTGASAGIGRELVRQLAPGRPELLLVARREQRLQELAAEAAALGATAHVLPCDLSDLDAVDGLAARVLSEHDGVDVVVNNAGHSIRRSLKRARIGDYERLIRLNYLAPVHLTLPLVARMRRAGRGHVVMVSTLATQFGSEPHFSAYIGSKGALDAFTRSAAPETLKDGVTWTVVHMPLVRTEMIAPTRQYDDVPALGVRDAAAMVRDAVVRRPARVTHPLGTALAVGQLVSPGLQAWGMSRPLHGTLREDAGERVPACRR